MAASSRPPPVAQDVRFCRTDDGVRLAWARHGSGPPLLIVSCWLSHLQHDWQSPVWRHFLDGLGEIATVIRYDERGFGLSEWQVADFSLQRRVADLEALRRRPSAWTGSPCSACRGVRPSRWPTPTPIPSASRVSRCTAVWPAAVCDRRRCGRGGVPGNDPRGLGATRPGVPAGVHERLHPRCHRTTDGVDGRIAADVDQHRERGLQPNRTPSRRCHHLLPGIAAPTLVLHADGDRVAPDWGPKLAAEIPDARLVMLESRNHVLLSDEPAWSVFRREIADSSPRTASIRRRATFPIASARSFCSPPRDWTTSRSPSGSR